MKIEKELEKYQKACEKIHKKKFKDFHKLEVEYCKLINKGTELRAFVLKCPEICNENTIKVLKNETKDITIIEDKFKELLNIISLKKELLARYDIYVNDLLKKERYEEAVNIYNQMFKFSPNYLFMLSIADLYYEKLGKKMQACAMMHEIEPHLKDNPNFYWKKAKICEDIKKYYHALLSIKKAVDLETKNA